MSQFSTNKGKDASGKKFASLNVNQTFKGTKAENRSAAGQPRHGMQSLGKVSQSRRVPGPAYLPSLKKENLGNDPTVSLVPSGSSGWVKKESSASKTEDQTQSGIQKGQKTDQASEISLRPNAGAGFKSQSDQGKGWGNLQSGAGATQPSSSNLFQREFPKLGVDGEGQSTEESARGKDSDEKEPASKSTTNVPPRFGGMPGQVPMQGPGQRPGGPPMNMSVEQQRALFNGAHMQPPGASQFYPYGPIHYMMMQPFPYPYGPNRMPPPGVMGQPPRPSPAPASSETPERPATVKTEDIQDMGDDSDDEGWAGAQEEVDYSVKLKFDESDEEPEATQTSSSEKASKDDRSTPSKESGEEKSRQNAPAEAWGDKPAGYQGNQMQFRHPQHWMGGPFPPYDPIRGPPPQGFPYPPPWMYPPGYPMPPVSQQRPDGSPALGQPITSGPPAATTQVAPTRSTPVAEDEKNAEGRKRREEDERNEAQRREAARVKLRELEEKIKNRHGQQQDSDGSKSSSHRERLDSENSDSSRGGSSQRVKSSRDMPPRFLKQHSHSKGPWRDDTAPTSPSPFDSSELGTGKDTIPVPRIMKRNDSLRSDDASSSHSHDSWANASLDEEDRTKDTEDMFTGYSKRTGRALESEVVSTQEENYERHERSEKSVGEIDARKKYKVVKPATWPGKDSKDIDEGQKSSRPPTVVGYDQRSQKSDQSGEPRRGFRGNDPRRDTNREYKSWRDNKDQGRIDKNSDWQESAKDDRLKKDKQREAKRESETKLVKKEAPKADVDVRGKDVKSAKDFDQEDGSKEIAEISQKEKRDSQEAGEKVERKPAERVTHGSSKPKPISDNFKRLEKSKGKSLSFKGSTTVEKEKRSVKSEQKSVSETKKPCVWSQVVSGETSDHPVASTMRKVQEQPKKSIVEIQKEEEIQNEKENLEQSNKESKGRQMPIVDRDGQDLQKDARATRDRKQDSRRRDEGRYNGRRATERHDDRYSDRRDYTNKRRNDRDMRRNEDRFDRKRTDGEDKETLIDSKHDGSTGEGGYDGRKRSVEDRKRRHDETDIPIFPYERIYFEEVEAEGRLRGQKVEKQKSFERRQDRTKFSERSRGMGRGRQPYSHSKGRGIATERAAGDSKEGYPFSEIKGDTYKNFAEKAASFAESRDAAKSDANSLEVNNIEDGDKKGITTESGEAKKEKENRESERAASRMPFRKSDSSYHEPRRPRDRQNSFDYLEKTGHRQDRSDSRRGRTSSRKYDGKREYGSDGKCDRRVENGSSANKAVEPRMTEKLKGGKEDGRGRDHVYGYYGEEDEQYEDVEEDYTDDDEEESDDERGQKDANEKPGGAKDEANRRSLERGPSKVLSSKAHKARQRDHRNYESGMSKSAIPPRFQKHRGSATEMRRGRGYPIRGSRGRGRLRGGRGHVFGKPSYSRDSRPKSSEGKGDEYSGESDDEYHSAEEALGSANEDLGRTETKHSSDYPKRHNARSKPSFKGSAARGRDTRRGGSADHFLGDRQQDRVGHIDASGLADTLPAAGKALFADQDAAEEKYGYSSVSTRGGPSVKRQIGDPKVQLTVESHHEFSEPPKKMAKSKSIEKQEFLRQFDVNNIASVVCVDDMPQIDGEGEDGFVEVCNRKKYKARNTEKVRLKEEEKKKLHEDMNMKSSKRSAGDSKETSSKAHRHAKVVEQHAQRPTQSFSPVTSQTQMATVSQSQTSNAAMAAVGGWEPAQALLRGVQMASPAENLDNSKPVVGPTQPPINAWKRPLSFAASLSSPSVTNSAAQASAPDPKAVGTGKPNASPAKQLPLVTQMKQPSDGVVANSSQMSFGDAVNEVDQAKARDLGLDGGSVDTVATEKIERPADGDSQDRKPPLNRQTDQRKVNKGTKRETAPRFQSMAKAKVPQNPVVMNGDVIGEKKQASVTMEDVPKSVASTLKVEDRAPGKRPDGSKLRRCNSESSKEQQPDNILRGYDGTEHPTLTFMHPDTLPEAEKAQPKITDEIQRREEGILGSLDSRLGKVDVQEHTTEEENAKDTARSVINSLGDENEKSLETRSLPSSTPPLAVDVHPPGPSTGPSSDPGIAKGPIITVPNSMSQEVNEMSKKVQSLKVLWDRPSLPEVIAEGTANLTTWSGKDSTVATSSVVTTTATTETDHRESGNVKDHIAPPPVAIVTAQGVSSKKETDLNAETSADPGLISKKTTVEQQNNVCKVKPQQKQQQQQLGEEKQILPSFSHSQLFQSPLPIQQAYTLSMQQGASNSKQPYMMSLERTGGSGVYSRERSSGDITSHHAQPHAPVGLQQVRSASPLSHHQQQDVLQQNVLFGNIYNTPTLQGTQQNTVLWPVVSRHGLQPSTSLSYMSHPDTHQDPSQDILSSPATFSSTPLYMTYDQTSSSVFSAQRMNSQLPQNPPVGLVLQQPQIRTASLFNVMQANQNSKDSSVFNMSPSPSPFQQVNDLQLIGMSQPHSDLRKHVNAKPFQPSSRTPPSAQPQQVMNQHSQFLGGHHAKYSSQVNKLGSQPLTLHQHQGSEQHSSSLHLTDKRQLMQQQQQQQQQQHHHHGNQPHSVQHLLPSHQQSVQPHSASQHSSMSHHIRPLALQQSALQQTSPFLHAFPSGRIASVGPRSAAGKTVTTNSQAPNRIGSMSPVDQNMHIIQGSVSSIKGLTQPHQLLSNSTGSSLVQVRPFTPSLPVGQQQSHPFTVRPTSQIQKYARVGPGPIQRPVKPTNQQTAAPTTAGRPKQPVSPMVKPTEAVSASKSNVASSIGSSFRNEEHQKMIEETKKYFAAQQQKNEAPSLSASAVVVPAARSEPISTTTGQSNVQVSIARTTESRGVAATVARPGKSVENKQVMGAESTPIVSESKSFKSTDVDDTRPPEIQQNGDKSNSEKKDLPDIAAAAMLNDPSDIISIIKSRPSLAKAFNIDGVNKEKGSEKGPDKGPDKGSEKARERKSSSKEEKPKRSGSSFKRGSFSRGAGSSNRWSSTKGDQKSSAAKPQTARKSEGSAEKSRSSNSRGKS